MKNNKSLGQHWLKNRAILDEIAMLAGGGEQCLEIGPGLGTLTSSLLKRFDKVIAVEYDENLARNLPKSFPGKNLEVVNADILEFDFAKIEGSYVAVGNIPYYITSPIIKKLLMAEHQPERIVLLIQREVAERITSSKETLMSLFVKNYAEVRLGPVVGRDEFTPPPRVDSQVVIFEPHAPEIDDKTFSFISRGFMAPRKKLIHNLAGIASKEEIVGSLLKIGFSSDARPGDLLLADWRKLYLELGRGKR